MSADEQQTLVLYDIEDDRIRLRVSETCKDYGLTRIQFSAFRGALSRNRRDELWLRLAGELGEEPGRILIQPICEKDAREGRTILVETATREKNADDASAPEHTDVE